MTRSSRFSTTTTASGMPVVEPTPHARKRALVRRGTLHSISSDEETSPRNSMVKSPVPQMPMKGGSISPLTRSYSSLERAADGKRMSQILDEDDMEAKLDVNTFQGRPKAYTLPPGLLRRQLNHVSSNQQLEESSDSSSDRRSSAGSTGSDVEPRRLSSICPPDLSTISEAKENDQAPSDIVTVPNGTQGHDDDVSTPTVKEKKNSSSLDKINYFRTGSQYSIYKKYTDPNLDYDLEEYEKVAPAMLQEVLMWDFSIDQLEKDSNNLILSRVSNLSVTCVFY